MFMKMIAFGMKILVFYRLKMDIQIALSAYAHENGCHWDEDTTFFAAENGHLECLKYAHENGCPWRDIVMRLTALNIHFDCLNYARENGCS